MQRMVFGQPVLAAPDQQFGQQLREMLAIDRAQHLARARIGAGRAAQAEVDAPRDGLRRPGRPKAARPAV